MKLTTLLLTSFVLITQTAFADGLLYQLPEDGAYVVYNLVIEVKQGEDITEGKGTFKMASVGSVIENGEKCRWIETKMIVELQGNKVVNIGKLLVPEKYLKAGENAFEKKLRGWVKNSDKEVKVMNKENASLMSVFLGGPLSEEKKLKPRTVDSKIGKLQCSGVSGYTKFRDQGVDGNATLKTRCHKKAPFGVVSSVIAMETEHTLRFQIDLKWTFTLKEIGKNAKSELADAK